MYDYLKTGNPRRDLFLRFLPVLTLLCVAFYFSCSTHFFPFSNESYGHDAGIFAYIGMALKEGKILYTEVWDNKGPLLYLINMLGVIINYYHGIYLLELLALFLALFFMYKTANLFFNSWMAMIAAVFSSIPLSVCLEGGNMSEEYALPFISLCLFIIVKFIKQDCNLKKIEMIVVGMTLSAVLLLRANILAFQGCLVLMVVIVLLMRKKYLKLLEVFLFALLGFAIFTAPFLIYLIANGALSECLNTVYFGAIGSFYRLSDASRLTNITGMIAELIESGTVLIIFLFMLALPIYHFISKKKGKYNHSLLPVLWSCFAAFFVNLAANSLSGASYLHYFITFVPIILMPSAWLFNMIYIFVRRNITGDDTIRSTVSLAAVCVVILVISINSFSSVTGCVIGNIRDENTPKAQYTRMGIYINENTDIGDTIQTFSQSAGVTANYRTKHLAASKYFYYANGIFADESRTKFANVIADDIIKNKPKLILIDYEEKYLDFVEHIENREEYLSMIEEYYVKEYTDFNCIVYKLK